MDAEVRERKRLQRLARYAAHPETKERDRARCKAWREANPMMQGIYQRRSASSVMIPFGS